MRGGNGFVSYETKKELVLVDPSTPERLMRLGAGAEISSLE